MFGHVGISGKAEKRRKGWVSNNVRVMKVLKGSLQWSFFTSECKESAASQDVVRRYIVHIKEIFLPVRCTYSSYHVGLY